MTEYSATEPSMLGARSPLFGTATFSTLSATQTPLSPSRYSSTARSLTPIASSYDSDDASSGRQMRRIVLSPPPSARRSDSDSYSDEDSIDDAAEVERALTMIDSELANTEEVLTEWSRGSSDVGRSAVSSHTGFTGSGSGYSGSVFPRTNTVVDRDARILSTISERTENVTSRPTSYSHSGGAAGSRPNTLYAINETTRSVSPSKHVRASTEPSGRPLTPGRISPPTRGKRTGELIALFEERTTPVHGHVRTSSAPMGPRSPSPYATTTQSRSLPTITPTSYAYGSGYGSRPSSPTKSGSVTGSGPVTTMSSVLSPGGRYTSTLSNTLTATRSTPTYTDTITSPTTDTLTHTFTTTQSSNTFTATPTQTSIRRPQGSPRSPLSSVRNIVAAWKDRTPSLGSKSAHSRGSPSPTPSDVSFSLRRRGSLRQRERTSGRRASDSSLLDPVAVAETRGLSEVSIDLTELGQYASARESQEPERIGLLWYLNVHAPPPYRWQRCQALLYPHMLLLSWIAPGGGRGIVTLDLLNCTEVLSVASPAHPAARDDIGTIAARMQADEAAVSGGSQPGEMGLIQTLCPFQLLYTDGIERLAAESPKERTHWVSAIWDVLQQGAESVPDRSVTRSPTGSVRTIRSVTSTSSTRSGTGSVLTTYIPPLDTIPDLSDIRSASSRSGLSRRSSLASAHRTRATDDAAASERAFLYPGDPRVIPPSRSSSLRRTSSLTDLDEAFSSALRRARDSRPGLGFGLGLAGGIPIGDGSPVTVSSGPRLGRSVFMSPPPSVGRGSEKAKSQITESAASDSDEAFFSARSRTNAPSYSLGPYGRGATNTNTETTTGLVTDETIHITSASGTEIVPSTLSIRGPASNSHLGDSHDSDSTRSYSATSPSRSVLTRSGGIRRRTLQAGSRSYDSSYLGSGEESSDKENTDTYTSYDSRSVTFTTLESYTRSGTFTGTYTPSGSYTPTPSYDRTTESRTESRLEDRTTEEESTPPTSEYHTAKEPSSPSFVSLDTIPSESDYDTAEVCSTDYETAPKCPSEPEPSDYGTADIYATEPPPSEYVTAEVCSTEAETDYETADCRCARRDEETVSIEVPPSEIPSIPEEIEPEDIPLPPSMPPSLYSPSAVSRDLLEGPETPRMAPVPSPSTEVPSESLLSTPSIPGPSPIPPSESLVELTPTPSSVSTPTESSITPTPSSMLTPTVPSTIEQPPTPSSPAIPESMWGAESDESYESSLLRASPSLQSLAAPEGLDTSFETSFLRPSHTITPSPQMTLMTPITEEVSTESVTIPSSPLSPSLTPTPSSMSLPITESGPSSTPVSTEMVSGLTRTPSSVSSVSMSSSVLYPRSLLDVPSILEPETEPSLLSTARSASPLPMRPISPRGVPLPSSPTPSQAPSVSMSVSLTTPRREAPSIVSQLETVPSEAPSAILTHDVNRLLQYLHDTDAVRGAENRDLADNVQALRDDVADLADYLHRVSPPSTPQPVLLPQPQVVLPLPPREEVPPPLPRKDRSVGGSSIISAPATPRAMTPRVIPAGPRPGTKATMIPYESPYRIPSPVTSESDAESFLSSHHSDDMSLMESETYPVQPMRVPSPSWPSDSSPSPESTPVSSLRSLPSEPELVPAMPEPVPVLTESGTPTPVPSSPTPSSDSGTARPAVPLNLGDLRDMIDGIRQRVDGLSDAQAAANRGIDDLRGRPVEVGLAECCEKIQRIEDALQRLLNLAQHPRAPPTEEGSEAMYPSDESLLRNLMDAVRGDRASVEAPILHAPVARPPMPSFEETLADMMTPSQPPLQQAAIQEPPAIIPLRYRPGPHTMRARSASPIFEADLPPRPGTFPQPAPVRIVYPPRQPRVAPAPGQPPAVYPGPLSVGPLPETVLADTPTPYPGPGPRTEEPGEDVDMLQEIRRRRADRRPDLPGGFWEVRPTTAPPSTTGPPRPGPQPGPGPGPGATVGPPPSFVPIPTAPTVLQLPLTFNDLVTLLRDNRDATLASIEQQQEITRYLTDLNHWLGRDVHDRHQELRSVHERLSDLGHRLDTAFAGQQPEGTGTTHINVVPPGGGGIPPPPMVTEFMPQPVGMPQPGQVYDVYDSRTPTPTFQPVIPGGVMPQQPGTGRSFDHVIPVVPDYPPPGPQPFVQPYVQPPPMEGRDGDFIPPAPHRPHSEVYTDEEYPPDTVTVIPPPQGQPGFTVVPPPLGPGPVPADEATFIPMPPSVPEGSPRSYYEPEVIPEVVHEPFQPPREPMEQRMMPPSDVGGGQQPITILPPHVSSQQPFVVQPPPLPPTELAGRPSSRGSRRSPVEHEPTTIIVQRSPTRTPPRSPSRSGREPIIVQPPYPPPVSEMPVPYVPHVPGYPRSPSRVRSPPIIIRTGGRTPSSGYEQGTRRPRSPYDEGDRGASIYESGGRPRSPRTPYDEGGLRGYSPPPAEHTAPYQRSPRLSRTPTMVEHYPEESPVLVRVPASQRASSARAQSPRYYSEDEDRPHRTRTPSYRPPQSEGGHERQASRSGPSIRRSPPPERDEERPAGYDPTRTRLPRPVRPGSARRPTPIQESPPPSVVRSPSPQPTHIPPGGQRVHSPDSTIIRVDEGAPRHEGTPSITSRRTARRPSQITIRGDYPSEPEAEHVRISRTPSDGSERQRAWEAPSRRPTTATIRTPRQPQPEGTDEERDEPSYEEPQSPVPRARTRPPTVPPTAGTVPPTEYEEEPEPEYISPEAEHIPIPEPTPRDAESASSPPGRPSQVQPRPITGFGDLGYADAERERDERFGELERQLTGTIDAVTEAERQRDENFRQNEDERDRIFAEHEEQRNREAAERREAILRELEGRIEDRLAAIEPPPIPVPPPGEPVGPTEPVDTAEEVAEEELPPPDEGAPAVSPLAETQSVIDASIRHAQEIADIVRLEREEAARDRDFERAERERIQAERDAEHARRVEELEARVRALEEEAEAARAELANERQLRMSEDAEGRERDRQVQTEQFEALRNQMLDFTNIATGLQDDMVRKREMMEQRHQVEDDRFARKEEWQEANHGRWEEVRDMVQQIIAERDADKAAQEGMPTLQQVMDELATCKTDMREQLENMSESWRALCADYHERTLNAVRENSQQQVQFNVQGYLDDFSKSLASEVRMLLAEVGNLRESRRAIQYELGCLLKMRAKYEPGGDFNPDWRPPTTQMPSDGLGMPPPGPPPPEQAPPPPEPAPAPARPAWRSVRATGRRSRRNQPAAPAPPPEAPPPPAQPPMSWLTWQPDPAFVPTPPTVEPTLLQPPDASPGLFGPRSPRGSMHR